MLNTTDEVVTNSSVMMSLWKHECTRVIADRFTELTDKDWFEKTLKQVRNHTEQGFVCLCVRWGGEGGWWGVVCLFDFVNGLV